MMHLLCDHRSFDPSHILAWNSQTDLNTILVVAIQLPFNSWLILCMSCFCLEVSSRLEYSYYCDNTLTMRYSIKLFYITFWFLANGYTQIDTLFMLFIDNVICRDTAKDESLPINAHCAWIEFLFEWLVNNVIFNFVIIQRTMSQLE